MKSVTQHLLVNLLVLDWHNLQDCRPASTGLRVAYFHQDEKRGDEKTA